MLTKTDHQLFLEAPLFICAQKYNRIHIAFMEFWIPIMNQCYEVERLAISFLEEFIANSKKKENILF